MTQTDNMPEPPRLTSILFLAADPTDATRLRLGQELREIEEKLQLAKLRDQFTLRQKMSVRPSDVTQALLDANPEIVHFSGHGTQAGELCFENEVGETHPIEPAAIAALFKEFSGTVKCVVLNACFSEAQAEAIAKHIPFVIGMSHAIGDNAAIAFAVGFYQALGAGRSIEEAYKLGCVLIGLQNIDERLIPVLITRKPSKPEAPHEPVTPPQVLSRRHQLPPPPGDFTGREEQLQALREAVSKSGATICGAQGMAGVGKTALALMLAAELVPTYPDAQIFLDLKGVDTTGKGAKPLSAEDAMRHMIASFHPEAKLPDSRAELEPLYRSVLHDQRALLLMDNAAGAEQVLPLVPAKPCLMIVTSRLQFALPGFKPVELPALPRPDSCKLLLEIESRIGKDADAIAHLCGDLPLALRSAASALKENPDLRVEDYLRRLGEARERLKLKPPGEAAVEASLQASHDLLAADRQHLFCALAGFPDSFLANAAAAVWDLDKSSAEEILSELRRYSLLEWDRKSERYRLHDVVRLFVAARPTEQDRHNYAKRHARHYLGVLALANRLFLRGAESVRLGLALFDLERLNVLAGQTWAASSVTQDEEATRLCSQYSRAGPQVLDLRLIPRQQIPWLEAAVEAAGRLGDKPALEAHLCNLGLAYAHLGETRKAIEYLEQVLAIAREIGDRRGEGASLGNLGLAYAALGETRKAIEHYEQTLAIMREIGDRGGENYALGNLGIAYKNLGETRKAIEHYEKVLAIALEMRDRLSEGKALGSLGVAYAVLGETRKAIEYYEQSLAIAREIGDRRGEGGALGNLGNAYTDLGETRKAIEYYEQRLTIAREIGDRRGEGGALGNLGNAYRSLGETRKAIELFEESLTIAREIGDRRGEGAALGNLGVAYAALGETRKAIELFEESLTIAREIGDRGGQATSLFNASLGLHKLGDTAKAVAWAKEALRIFTEIESPHAEKVRRQLRQWGAA